MLEREDIEAVIACLGDDAAQLRDDNPEDERADNMDRAATMLRELADSNAAVARLLLDQNREGAKGWARGIHINMDGEGGLTVSAASAVSPSQAQSNGPFFRPADLAKAIMTPEQEAAVRDLNWCWKCACALVVDVHREGGMRWMQCKHCTTVYALKDGVSPSQAQSVEVPEGMSRIDAFFWLEHRAAIIEALAKKGWRIVTNAENLWLATVAGIQSPAAPVGALACLACGGDATGGKCKNRRCIGGPIVEEVEAAPVGGEDDYYSEEAADIAESRARAASVLEAQPPAPAGWWTEELERIFTASRGTVITDEMKRAAAIALHIARGQRWDDAKQEWTDGVLEAQPQPSDQGEKNAP